MKILFFNFSIYLLLYSVNCFSALQSSNLVRQNQTHYNAITYDSETNLEWADVNLTKGLSYSQVSTNILTPSWIFEGFRYATKEEIVELFAHGGVEDLNRWVTPVTGEVTWLGNSLGSTFSRKNDSPYLQGIYEDNSTGDSKMVATLEVYGSWSTLGYLANTSYSHVSPNDNTSYIGSFLVREKPFIQPTVTNFTPVYAPINRWTPFIITGGAFSEDMDYNIQNANCVNKIFVSSSELRMDCTHNADAVLTYSVKVSSGGLDAGGAPRGTVNFTVPELKNQPPVVSDMSIGATLTGMTGSFSIADTDGDKVMNLRLLVSSEGGLSCHTGYLNGAYRELLSTGTINFISKDCMDVLKSESTLIYEIEAYDEYGLRAEPVTGVVTRLSSNTINVPSGAEIRWDSVPDTVNVNQEYTLQLSMVDSSGVVIDTFSSAGILDVYGLDVETRDRRIVIFENGVARIKGFRVISEGSGSIWVKVVARVADISALATTKIAVARSISYSERDIASGPISLDTTGLPMIQGKKSWVRINKVLYNNKKQDDGILYAINELGERVDFEYKNPWLQSGYWQPKNDSIIRSGDYQFYYRHAGGVEDRQSTYTIAPCTRHFGCIDTLSEVSFTDGQKRPVILLHGVFGSTFQPDGGMPNYPRMPKGICTLGSSKAYFKNPDCNKLTYYNVSTDGTGWKGLEQSLIQRGFDVIPVAWDWRSSPDTIVNGFINPAIEGILSAPNQLYKKVDIVAHSMGGLIARWLIQEFKTKKEDGSIIIGTTKVDRLIMIGTPNGGSVNAFYLLSQGATLALDDIVPWFTDSFPFISLGKVARPRFYTNVINNLVNDSLTESFTRRLDIDYNYWDDKVDADGFGSAIGFEPVEYAWKYRKKQARVKLIESLASGAKILNPLFEFMQKDNVILPTPVTADNPDGNILYNLQTKNLLCYDDVQGHRSNEKEVFTWLLLTTSKNTIRYAQVKTNNGFYPVSSVATDMVGDIEVEEAAGDGTVPLISAIWGLNGISKCIDESIGSTEHGAQPTDSVIRTKVGDLLAKDRGVVQAQVKTLSLVAQESVIEIEPPKLGISVGLPLPTALEKNGQIVGINFISGALLEELPGAFLNTYSSGSGFSVNSYSAGNYLLSIESVDGYMGRLLPVNMRTIVNDEQKGAGGWLITQQGINDIGFEVTAENEINLLDRPQTPINVLIDTDFNNNPVIYWEAAENSMATAYRIYARNEGELNFTKITELPVIASEYTIANQGMVSGDSEADTEYLVVAVNASGLESFVSNRVSNRVNEFPEAITFSTDLAQSDNLWFYSEPQTVSGINVPVTVSITGGEYSIDGGAYTSEPDSISSGQTIVLRVIPPFVTEDVAIANAQIGTEVFSFEGNAGQNANFSCGSDDVVISNKTYASNANESCTATSRLTANGAVLVSSGATVNYQAPIIVLKSGFKVVLGGHFNAKSQ